MLVVVTNKSSATLKNRTRIKSDEYYEEEEEEEVLLLYVVVVLSPLVIIN